MTVIESWIDPALRRKKGWMQRLTEALEDMRRELRQKEVACIYDGKWILLGDERKKKT